MTPQEELNGTVGKVVEQYGLTPFLRAVAEQLKIELNDLDRDTEHWEKIEHAAWLIEVATALVAETD